MKNNIIYFVAIAYAHSHPLIVETFNNRADANTYAAFMCRTKQRSYIVLEQVCCVDPSQEIN